MKLSGIFRQICCMEKQDLKRFPVYLFVFSPNAGKCGKNPDQNNSEYVLFLHRPWLYYLHDCRLENETPVSRILFVIFHFYWWYWSNLIMFLPRYFTKNSVSFYRLVKKHFGKGGLGGVGVCKIHEFRRQKKINKRILILF